MTQRVGPSRDVTTECSTCLMMMIPGETHVCFMRPHECVIRHIEEVIEELHRLDVPEKIALQLLQYYAKLKMNQVTENLPTNDNGKRHKEKVNVSNDKKIKTKKNSSKKLKTETTTTMTNVEVVNVFGKNSVGKMDGNVIVNYF